MSAPTTYLKTKSPYGDINAKVEYSNNNQKITIILSYKDLAEILEKSNKPNLASLNLILFLEEEDMEAPEESQFIELPIPEALKYKAAAELKNLGKWYITNKRKFTSKENRKSIDELQKQLINLNIEFYTALKYLKENSSPNPEQDNKYIETLETII